MPVSLVDQLRGAANNAAADGRPLSQEDWGKILAVSGLGFMGYGWEPLHQNPNPKP